MSLEYQCKRCSYKTNRFSNLVKHLNIKKQCTRTLESYNYSNDQLLILSLIPYVQNNHLIKENEIEYLKNSNNIVKHKDELLLIIDNIDKQKLKICNCCSQKFEKIIELKKHIIISCFYKKLEKENKIEKNDKKSINNIECNNMINSQITTNNITNITNNINHIHLDIKNIIPFDEDWNISKIDELMKTKLIFSNIMYTKLLEEILKNETNLNIIIDKNDDSGMVYKNDIDKYIKMKIKDIIDNSMEKLHKNLIDFNTSIFNENFYQKSFLNSLNESKNLIESKHLDYKNNLEIQKNVINFISDMFEKKKEDAVEISNKIINNNIGF
jgi:hypothetical protein